MTDIASFSLPSQHSALTESQLNRIDEAAQEFEGLVLSQLLAPIFASVERSDLTGAGPQNDAFQSLLQEEYAKSIAARGGLGIADQVKASLIALQAQQSPPLTIDAE